VGGRSFASPSVRARCPWLDLQPMGLRETTRDLIGIFVNANLLQNCAISTGGARDGIGRVGHQPVVWTKGRWVISYHMKINHGVPQRERCLRECLTSQAGPMPRCWRRHPAVATSRSARHRLNRGGPRLSVFLAEVWV
jgi:hypothetical protein